MASFARYSISFTIVAMKNWKNKLPTREKIFASRLFKPFAKWFEHDYFWAFERDRVALAAAIGLYCGMVPTPFQFVAAFIAAYFLRAQLPVALFSTLYTNPVTLVPLYFVAYELGIRLLYGDAVHLPFALPYWGAENAPIVLWLWLKTYGTPWLVGSMVMALTFASVGYCVVQLVWRWRDKRKMIEKSGI